MPKQLLYLTNNVLTATMWQESKLAVGPTFENNAQGWEEFSTYLANTSRNIRTYLLTDLIEEDFQRENIPHVLGSAKTALIQRRLNQLYRETPFRHFSSQGREDSGRRDDRMLFSALTNAELPKPWLEAISMQKIPLVGIYSVSLLAPLLSKKLSLDSGHLLLVTHQSAGLRSSYFYNGYLKFSRLTPVAAQDVEAVTETTMLEMAKTRQFLTSTRLVGYNDLVHVVILANKKTLPILESRCENTPKIMHRIIDLDRATMTLRQKNLLGIDLCDALFLSLLARNTPADHYPQFETKRFYTVWQARTYLYVLSFITFMGALVWSGANSLAARKASNQTAQLSSEANIAHTRYQAVMKNMPPTIAPSSQMKAAVSIDEMIAQNVPTPTMLLGIISNALEHSPQIRLNNLRWQTSETDGATLNLADLANLPLPSATETTPPSGALIGIPKKPFEMVVIEGEALTFKEDYRRALEVVRKFTADLNRNKQIQATITRQPLDIRPLVKLEGQAGKEDEAAKAQFALTLIWKP